MGKKLRQTLYNRRGFTLVELIVVLVILAILAAIMVPALLGYIDKTKATRCLMNRSYVTRGYQLYHIEHQDMTLDKFMADDTLWQEVSGTTGCPYGGNYSVIDHAIVCDMHSGAVAINTATNVNLFNNYKSVKGINNYNNSDMYSPAKAFDSNLPSATRWASKDYSTAASSLEMALNGPTLLNTIKIMQYSKAIKSYTIEYKAPGSDTWIVLTSGGTLTTGPTTPAGFASGTYDTINFSTITATALKFTFTNQGSAGASIWDIQGIYTK